MRTREMSYSDYGITEDEVLNKRNYKFPHDNFDAEIEIDDIGYSDNILLLGITTKGE